MKKFLLATAALATIGIATPALADGDNTGTDTTVFNISANNPAKCNLTAANTTLTLANNRISDNDGFARTTVSSDVAAALNSAGVNAWCTGSTNSLQMYRTALTTGNGNQTVDSFEQAVVYDVTMDIADAVRADNYHPTEGTSDGQGNGPGLGVGSGIPVRRFGPTGAGSSVVFAAELPSAAASNGGTQGTGARSGFSETPSNRLVAGSYTSTLTIELTPGV